MKKLFVVAAWAMTSAYAADLPAHCADQRQLTRLPKTCRDGEGTIKLTLPSYVRVHPSGKFALANINGRTILLDLDDPRNPRCATVPLAPEAYPVEPSWDLISSHDSQTMNYYSFAALRAYAFPKPGSSDVKPLAVLSDDLYNEFYQSHGTLRTEVLADGSEKVTFRSVYFTHLYAHEISYLRKNGELQPTPPSTLIAYNLKDSLPGDIAMPVVSKDGRFLSVQYWKPGSTDATSRIYEVIPATAEKSVTIQEVANLGTSAGKLSFEYPSKRKLPRAAYRTSVQIGSRYYVTSMIYDPNSKKHRLASFPWLEFGSSNPNFTAAGNLMYFTEDQDGLAMVTLNPDQMPEPVTFEDCFKKEYLKLRDSGQYRSGTYVPDATRGALDPREHKSMQGPAARERQRLERELRPGQN